MAAIAPDLPLDLAGFEHSPITGIHLWFDRPVTDLPHATLLDRTIQWMFNKSDGRYVQLVVSASRSLETMPRAEVIAMAIRELAEFFPAVIERQARKSARGQGNPRHVLRRPWLGVAPAAQPHVDPEPLSGRRLDPFRLARHHGRSRSQRLSGGGGHHRQEVCSARYRIIDAMGKFLASLLIAAPIFAADLTKLEIHVTSETGRPIDRASVVVKFVDGRSAVKFGAKIRKEWDVKTSQEGTVKIPPIPKGKILFQVRADNFQTFGQTFDIQDDEKIVEIKLKPPQAQYSAHDKDK